MPEIRLLHSGFLNSAGSFPNRPAIAVAGETLTYSELMQKAASLAATVAELNVGHDPPLTAVFAYRSVTAFAGILGSLIHGHGYVPLNRTFPTDRTTTMLRRSGCRTMIVDEPSEIQIDEVLAGTDREIACILPHRADTKDLESRWPRHRFVGADRITSCEQHAPADTSPDSPAYVLFTSGSTGRPKGVVVTHANATHYVEFIAERYQITEQDRFSQVFDMTFDLSVSDLFVAWSRGACVCCPSEKAVINPGRFIKQAGLTVWFSVPSTAIFMKRLGTLKPGSYPDLRVSLFCGEALPVQVAKAWAEAAPKSIIENLYGPTELTIACTYYRWDAELSPDLSERGVVPIGDPFPDMLPIVVDERLQEVGPGESGELLMAGPQVSPGYWKDTERTAAVFLVPPNRLETFYRTGDLVRKPTDGRPMTYLGRVDNQVQILGHRVELAEVEAVVREESEIDGVVALGWPPAPGGAGGIEVFLEGSGAPSNLKERVAARLPVYMVPRSFRCLARLPLNANGKYDRKALARRLEAEP